MNPRPTTVKPPKIRDHRSTTKGAEKTNETKRTKFTQLPPPPPLALTSPELSLTLTPD